MGNRLPTLVLLFSALLWVLVWWPMQLLAGPFLVSRAGGPNGSGAGTPAYWLALRAGVTFGVSNLVTRAARRIPIASKTVATTLGCALFSALTLGVLSQPMPSISVDVG